MVSNVIEKFSRPTLDHNRVALGPTEFGMVSLGVGGEFRIICRMKSSHRISRSCLISHKIPSPALSSRMMSRLNKRSPSSPMSKTPAPPRNSSAYNSAATLFTRLETGTGPASLRAETSRCSIGVVGNRRGDSISRTTAASASVLRAPLDLSRCNETGKSRRIFDPQRSNLVMFQAPSASLSINSIDSINSIELVYIRVNNFCQESYEKNGSYFLMALVTSFGLREPFRKESIVTPDSSSFVCSRTSTKTLLKRQAFSSGQSSHSS